MTSIQVRAPLPQREQYTLFKAQLPQLDQYMLLISPQKYLCFNNKVGGIEFQAYR